MSSIQKHSLHFGNASSTLATTVTNHSHPGHSEHVFAKNLTDEFKAFQKEFGLPTAPAEIDSETKATSAYNAPPAYNHSLNPQSAVIHQNAYTTLQPAVIYQDAFTTLQPKQRQNNSSIVPVQHNPFISNTASSQPEARFNQNSTSAINPKVLATNQTGAIKQNPTSKKPSSVIDPSQLLPDRMHQLVSSIGIVPKDFTHSGYFEKMSKGSVFARKTLLPTSYAAVPLSFGALGTAIALKGTATAHILAGAKGAAAGGFLAGTGAAVGTGVGAGVAGSLLASYLGWAGYRSAKVMNNYKQLFGKIKSELLQPGNENAVRWYLRTLSAGSAKTKAKRNNSKTLMQLQSIQNPNIAAHQIYKIYMRYARNQNAVFVTRSPEHARRLLAEADRRTASRENIK